MHNIHYGINLKKLRRRFHRREKSDRRCGLDPAARPATTEHLRLFRNPVEGRQNARMKVETIVNYGNNALIIGRVSGQPMGVLVASPWCRSGDYQGRRGVLHQLGP